MRDIPSCERQSCIAQQQQKIGFNQ